MELRNNNQRYISLFRKNSDSTRKDKSIKTCSLSQHYSNRSVNIFEWVEKKHIKWFIWKKNAYLNSTSIKVWVSQNYSDSKSGEWVHSKCTRFFFFIKSCLFVASSKGIMTIINYDITTIIYLDSNNIRVLSLIHVKI